MTRSAALRLIGGLAIATALVAIAFLAGSRMSAAAELRSWCAVLAAAYLLVLAGLVPAWLLTEDRILRDRAQAVPDAMPAPASPTRQPAAGDAQWSQILAILLPVAVALMALARMPPHAGSSAGALWLAIGCFALVFPTIVVERVVAELSGEVVPEQAALARLLRVPSACAALCGLSLLASVMGWPGAWWLQWPAFLLVGLVACELALRALAFAVIGSPLSRANADSLLAGVVLSWRNPLTTIHQGLRERFGIDLTQSWSARIMARAAPWVALGILVLGWGLSAVSVVPLGSRLVIDGGAAVRVLPAGAHLHAPFPFTTRLLVEDGRIHETALGELDAPLPVIAAQEEPAAAFDRRWDVVHPADSDFLVPATSTAGTGQGFRVIAGDVRVQWRIGRSDADAILAVSRLAELDVVVKRASRRALTCTCAGHTLASLMGSDRDHLGEALRATVQSDIDQLAGGRSGLDVVAIVIDALHPPAGAAVAYQNVQASEIGALAAVAISRAAAAKSAGAAAIAATTRLSDATALAGEISAHAHAEAVRFDQERISWQAHPRALAVERYLDAFKRSVVGKPLILLDDHLDLSAVPGLGAAPFLVPPPPGQGGAAASAPPSSPSSPSSTSSPHRESAP